MKFCGEGSWSGMSGDGGSLAGGRLACTQATLGLTEPLKYHVAAVF